MTLHLPPSNGYIDSYNRTAEGRFVCQNKPACMGEMQEAVWDLHTAVCTLDGTWEPNLDVFCSNQGICMTFILLYNIITRIYNNIIAI